MATALHRIRSEIMEEWHEQVMALTLETFAEELVQTVRNVAPVGVGDDDEDREHLRDSHYLNRQGRFDWLIESSSPHAEFVIRGTGPHIIRARPGSVLHWNQGGQDRFAASVRHPGTEPQNYVQRAIDIEEPRLPSYFNEANSAVVRRLRA